MRLETEVNYKRWAKEFADIGAALTEKRSLPELLETILSELRTLTHSDAGSIYRVIEDGESESYLHFEQAQNDSIDLPRQEFKIPLDRSSIAGYVASEGEVLNVSDVYELSDDVPYSFDRSFDEQFGYRTKSMLVVPLKDRHGGIHGVLQLMNRKENYDLTIDETTIQPYPRDLMEMVNALSSQAAVAMERAELDESIQSMIQSMIGSLVNALDQRDEITTGHSRRIAGYGLKLARAINQSDKREWSKVTFSESDLRLLFYAGLLHDIGKIAVSENVLSKKNRLSDDRMEAIRYRLAYIDNTDQAEDDFASIFKSLSEINQSGYLEDDEYDFLEELHSKQFETPDGHTKPWLTQEEFTHLSIKKGNLTVREREQIQYHAKATYEILKQIDWTDELENVPRLAALHHEKLDGSGYPWGYEADDIPLLARILCVVDIYEALTARDRPYKPAMPPEQARDILEEEAEQNHVDSEVVQIFFDDGLHTDSFDESIKFSDF